MQVQSISSRSVNFQGLWEDVVTKRSQQGEYKVYDDYKTYHPFANESEKDLQRLRMVNTATYKHNGHYAQDMYISNSKCYIKEKLPITIDEWKVYEKNKVLLGKKTIRRIEDTLKERGLTKYIK